MTARSSFVTAMGMAVILTGVGYRLMGSVPAIIFAVFLIGALIPWRLTTYGRPADPDKIVIPYLLTVVFFIVHVIEEYQTQFWVAISELSGHHVPEENFLLVAAFIGPILWLTGLIFLYARTELGNYFTWAFLVAMTVSELAHFIFPLAAYGEMRYFSGLYTAVLPLFPAGWCIYQLIQQSSAPRQSGSSWPAESRK